MPFYEYECQSCKFYAEVMQKISDPPLVKCPSCGKRTMQKLISAPVFRLKGSGWYETDFKSDKEDKRNLAVEREEPKPAEETKAETKAPAAESAPKPAESKASGAAASVTTSAGAGKHRAAPPPRKRPAAAAKASARPAASRGKVKPAARPKAKKRGSRR
jgi:putative FmdB family regulatory protein